VTRLAGAGGAPLRPHPPGLLSTEREPKKAWHTLSAAYEDWGDPGAGGGPPRGGSAGPATAVR